MKSSVRAEKAALEAYKEAKAEHGVFITERKILHLLGRTLDALALVLKNQGD